MKSNEFDYSKIDLRKVFSPERKGEELKKREDFLRAAGFSNKWIEEVKKDRPSLYDPDQAQNVLDCLKALGFANPEKMIASFSPILGLNIENIRKKISTVDTIFKLYDIEIETNHFIEENLSLLGTKIDKIWIIARMLRALEFDRNLITESFLSRLLFSNITDATVATALLNQSGRKNFSRGEIVGAIHEAKTKSAEEKNNIIDKLDNSKLKRRYARGYGERKSKIS